MSERVLQKVKKGRFFENRVKEVLEQHDFTVIEELSDGKPIDIAAICEEIDLPILCECKYHKFGNYFLSKTGGIFIQIAGKQHGISKSTINELERGEATFKGWLSEKFKGEKPKHIHKVVVTTATINRKRKFSVAMKLLDGVVFVNIWHLPKYLENLKKISNHKTTNESD